MIDNLLINVHPIQSKTLKKAGLQWLAAGENADYLAPEFIKVQPEELRKFQIVSTELYDLAIRAAQHIADNNLWEEAGIPNTMIDLVQYSLRNELDYHLVGRFDFAGGLAGKTIQLLEFNADTCSLMPETAQVQQMHFEQERKYLPGSPASYLVERLTMNFNRILEKNPHATANILLSTLGFPEDWLNSDLVALAAQEAGFDDIQSRELAQVHFSDEEGIFIEAKKGEYRRFDFWFKMIPWEFIAYEEPELLAQLSTIIQKGLVTVLNPAWTMLLQSKAILKYMYELDSKNPYLLATHFSPAPFRDKHYVRKPIFGRMGENIDFHRGSDTPDYSTEGDYGDFPSVYQEVARFNMDEEEHRYQPSIYWTSTANALCFRRQDDLVIDDDAEFIGSVVDDGSQVAVLEDGDFLKQEDKDNSGGWFKKLFG